MAWLGVLATFTPLLARQEKRSGQEEGWGAEGLWEGVWPRRQGRMQGPGCCGCSQ